MNQYFAGKILRYKELATNFLTFGFQGTNFDPGTLNDAGNLITSPKGYEVKENAVALVRVEDG